MSLAPGTRLGPYEVIAPLGAGGMGEVYRARDPRLGRDVAIKVLPGSFAQDPERLARFEREARAAAAIAHPGIATLFDVGSHEGAPYLVWELIEGGTLRDQLRADGRLAPARAVEILRALAEALAAAHARGVVHRDLKPENVAFGRDGRVRLLDFGLAKILQGPAGASEETSARTIDGAMMGTVAYMAPEQARGTPADHRADLFALGCVLHEMLEGASPFHRPSAAETIAALLKEDPAPLSPAVRQALPGIDVMLRRCLEKDPDRRLQSAADLAVALEALDAARGAAPAAGAAEARPVSFHRLTYRRGNVRSARFTPDGRGVVYSASWDGQPLETFWNFGGPGDERTIGLVGAEVLSVSRHSELAISRNRRDVGAFISSGTLARVPLGAGAPRDLRANVMDACWSPDGQQMAMIADDAGVMRLEYPAGRPVFRSEGGWISSVRVSRDGKRVAFVDHPKRGDDHGIVTVAELGGGARRVSEEYEGMRGLAWAPDDRAVWVTGAVPGPGRALTSFGLDGSSRTLLQLPGGFRLHDVAPDGRVLLVHGEERMGIRACGPGEAEERDLSWHDWSLARDLSRDGRRMVFDESGSAGGDNGTWYLRELDGSPAVRMGEGKVASISPDGETAVVLHDRGRLSLVPLGLGETRDLDLKELRLHNAVWAADGAHLWLAANRAGDDAVRVFRVGLDGEGSDPHSAVTLGMAVLFPSPDGTWLGVMGADQHLYRVSADGGEAQRIPGVEPGEHICGFAPDGRRILVFIRGEQPARTHFVDLATGERTFHRSFGIGDPTGNLGVYRLTVSLETGAYLYSYDRLLNDLYLVEGLV
jgi:eukaryotic-like serine/threonine-protein kinase